MQGSRPRSTRHQHTIVTLRALRQRSGIPYEVVRQVCSSCRRVVDERPLRRAAG